MNSNIYIPYVIINSCEVYKEVKLLAKLSTRKTNISENKVMKKNSMNLNFEIYKIFYVLQKTNSFSLDIQKEKNLYTS